jgi:hypothetical protein
MRGLFCIALVRGSLIITALLALPSTSMSETAEGVRVNQPESSLQLISHTQTKPAVRTQSEPPPPSRIRKLRAKRDLPSLNKLGLILESSETNKRDALNAIKIEPWAPGRGAIGVRLELTW